MVVLAVAKAETELDDVDVPIDDGDNDIMDFVGEVTATELVNDDDVLVVIV